MQNHVEHWLKSFDDSRVACGRTVKNAPSFVVGLGFSKSVTCKSCKRLLTQRAADEATPCAHRAPRVAGVGLFICDDCGKTLHR